MRRFAEVLGLGTLAVLIVVGMFGISWIITCGFVKLITMCLGLKFTWLIGTGVWLILYLLRWSLHNNNSCSHNNTKSTEYYL